ncbi:hypothetical protein RBB50_012049 [Rhinocladiella similis]
MAIQRRTNTDPANTRLNFRYTQKDCPGHEYVGKLNEGGMTPMEWTCQHCACRTKKAWECQNYGFLICNPCSIYSTQVTGKLAKDQPKYIGRKYG